ncbi:uncharacterized protein LOC129407682 isoform X2 [Boleophthalmus pectinirostris]|uniref:uncharacterized protein LOC129407682 isoform X2 n=1 Tax=Boleophthalmus pectinirostris TaxID=150288 RepID=UPI002431B9D5|nr:uncharacterized protein LOC129407682 isoform X2 [Boleophthalmus pectinirostris]
MACNLLWTLDLILFFAVLTGMTKGNDVTNPKTTVYYEDTVYFNCQKNQSGAPLPQNSNVIHSLTITNTKPKESVKYSCSDQGVQITPTALTIIKRRRKVLLTVSQNTSPVMLNCSIEDFEGQYVVHHNSDVNEMLIWRSSHTITVHEGGVYSCYGWNGLVKTEKSNSVIISEFKCFDRKITPESMISDETHAYVIMHPLFVRGYMAK